jgi:hypothetical protein
VKWKNNYTKRASLRPGIEPDAYAWTSLAEVFETLLGKRRSLLPLFDFGGIDAKIVLAPGVDRVVSVAIFPRDIFSFNAALGTLRGVNFGTTVCVGVFGRVYGGRIADSHVCIQS